MWCPTCRDDVLAITSTRDENALECIECKKIVFIDGPSEGVRSPLMAADAWAAPQKNEPIQNSEKHQRFDRSHTKERLASSSRRQEFVVEESTRTRRNGDGTTHASVLVWCALAVGLASLTCGVVLLSWSAFHSRDDLWRLGLPAGLGGLVLFLVGMVLQLDVLNSYAREAAASAESTVHFRQDNEASQPSEPAETMRDLQNRLNEFITKVPY